MPANNKTVFEDIVAIAVAAFLFSLFLPANSWWRFVLSVPVVLVILVKVFYLDKDCAMRRAARVINRRELRLFNYASGRIEVFKDLPTLEKMKECIPQDEETQAKFEARIALGASPAAAFSQTLGAFIWTERNSV